jgi:hypothetical protein
MTAFFMRRDSNLVSKSKGLEFPKKKTRQNKFNEIDFDCFFSFPKTVVFGKRKEIRENAWI